MASFNLSPDAVATLAAATLHDQIVGSIVGSALGDAVGLYTEFLSEDLSAQAYPSRSFILSPPSRATPFRRDPHRNPHHPGEWTDDTDHAMLLLLSYLHADGKELNPQDFARRLRTWVQCGLIALDTLPLGLGRTVGSIVRSKSYLDNPEKESRDFWMNSGCENAPNGSLMRTHPLGPMCLNKTIEETFEIAAGYSVMTHVDPRCIISCAVGTAIIRGLLRGEVKTEEHIDGVMEMAVVWYATYRERHLQDELRKSEPDLDRDEFLKHAKVNSLADLKLDEPYKIGYVYKTFGAGIHVLRLCMRAVASTGGTIKSRTTIFEPLITDLVMRGGDADTNACFAGALMGAYLGYGALPQNWTSGLRFHDWLIGKAEGLCQLLGVVEGNYCGSKDKDTALDGGRGFPTQAYLEEKAMRLQARMVADDQELKKKQLLDEKKKKTAWVPWS